MGINETRYPFMDEGWATTTEFLVGRVNMGREGETKIFQNFRVTPWVTDRSPLEEIPVITPEDVLKNPTYRTNAYGKPALGYLAVKDFLGDSVFRRALHGYMEAWHGKHPTPWDFFATMNAASGHDLDWFWSNWFLGPGTIDLAVKYASRVGNGYAIDLENIGGLAAPVDLLLTFGDGSTQRVHETIAMWERNQRRTTVRVPAYKSLRSVQLSADIWMDADPANDRWPAARTGKRE
jgi:aminopeptidase N